MSEYDSTELEAIQAVVDRVSAYQDGATEDTVAKELREGLDEAGIDLEADQVKTLAAAIYEADGDVSAADVLG